MSRGAGNHAAPLTYSGDYDPDRTYLPREVVVSSGSVFMALSKHSGIEPPDPAHWLVLGGPVIFRSNEADGPPTDGSPFWLVLDATC